MLQDQNGIGDAGATVLGEALKVGAKDTTLHARVPGKPVELIGLDCVTSGMRLPLVASCIKYLCLCPSPPNGGKRERCRQLSVYGV